MPVPLSSLADAQLLEPPHIAWFGPPKSGKTAAAMTLGELLELIDLDNGITTGLRVQDKWTETRKKVQITQCRDDNAMKPNAFYKCKTRLMEIANACAQKTNKCKVACVDSLTSLSNACQRYVRGNSGNLNSAVPMTMPDWQNFTNEMQQVIDLLLNLPIPTILISHEEIIEIPKAIFDPNPQKRIVLFCDGRQISPKIGALFGEIWYQMVSPGGGGALKYLLCTQGNSNLACGSRLGVPSGTDTADGLVAILAKAGYKL